MSEVILFPDVEGMLIAFLTEKFVDTPVSTIIPDPRPERFIQASQVGGSKARINADSVNITFKCWDESSVEASELARMARAYLHSSAGEFINGVWVYRVRDIGGVVSSPDPHSDSPRYQFTLSIDVKGEPINEVQAPVVL